jgi:hypothetical protein
MNAKPSPAAPTTDLGGDRAFEEQDVSLVPVEKESREHGGQDEPAPAGPIKLVAAPNESATDPKHKRGRK